MGFPILPDNPFFFFDKDRDDSTMGIYFFSKKGYDGSKTY
jgi:hypothetical protein